MGKILTVLATMLILFCNNCFAGEIDFPKHIFNVKVSVSGNEKLKDIISSYVKRELRSLQDVKVVDSDDYWWVLSITALLLESKGGHRTGVALSIVIQRKMSNELLTNALCGDCKQNSINSDVSIYELIRNILRVGSYDDLQMLCTEVVADFDTKNLEEGRKSIRKYIDFMDDLKKKK